MAGDSSAIERKLAEFIKLRSSQKFDWLACNCGFWVCDWISFATGIDPVAGIRNRFLTSLGFQRYVRKCGGNKAFSRMIAEQSGMKETASPKIGDVGLIETISGAAMAICAADKKWVGKSSSGILIASFPLIVAWEL